GYISALSTEEMKTPRFSKNPKTNIQMKKMEKFSSILGRDVFETDLTSLSAEDLQKINDHQDAPVEATSEAPEAGIVLSKEEL
ncbi:hypothetical protein M3M33_16120, partial [Loigolactobacillus coryniformis]|uniref:hypothetical protein n=1 Tax=Loigolactobacillus coryniformis TaxID=1610 RepID=UPI00201A663B